MGEGKEGPVSLTFPAHKFASKAIFWLASVLAWAKNTQKASLTFQLLTWVVCFVMSKCRKFYYCAWILSFDDNKELFQLFYLAQRLSDGMMGDRERGGGHKPGITLTASVETRLKSLASIPLTYRIGTKHTKYHGLLTGGCSICHVTLLTFKPSGFKAFRWKMS